jgi:hypothetical protein
VSIFERLRQKLAASSRYPADYWPSVVVLLAKPIFPAKDEILARAQQAWGNAGQAKLMGTLRDGASHLVQCGPMFFSIHCTDSRYGQSSERGDDVLQKPWHDHQAWMSVDLPNLRNEPLYQSGDLGKMYKVLLIFVFLCWTSNCLGVYFPGEGVTVPNLGDLAGSINWGRRNGLNLNFLN